MNYIYRFVAAGSGERFTEMNDKVHVNGDGYLIIKDEFGRIKGAWAPASWTSVDEVPYEEPAQASPDKR